MRKIGFSTGALAKGDFNLAIQMLERHDLCCIELSALRSEEVAPLIEALETLPLDQYSYVSIHAPSQYKRNEESAFASLLFEKTPENWSIVLHPDAIWDFDCWKRFGTRLAIENMDRRKPCGRNVIELNAIFEKLPQASLCFDIGHARQLDSSMTEAFLMLTTFRGRISQLHISEVNAESQHDSISYGTKVAFQQVADLIDPTIPVIIESRVKESAIEREVVAAREALRPGPSPKAEEMTAVFQGLSSLVQEFAHLGMTYSTEPARLKPRSSSKHLGEDSGVSDDLLG